MKVYLVFDEFQGGVTFSGIFSSLEKVRDHIISRGRRVHGLVDPDVFEFSVDDPSFVGKEFPSLSAVEDQISIGKGRFSDQGEHALNVECK